MATDIFSYDEKLVLNTIGLYASLKDCINLLLIQLSATQDDDIKSLYTELHTKLKQMNEIEWQEIQNTMPFDVPYGFYDEEAEQEYTDYTDFNDEDYNEFLSMIDELKQKSEEEERKKAEEAEKQERGIVNE